MLRPVRHYKTEFRIGDRSVTIDTIGDSPCNAKNVGWVLLSRYLREHPDLPENGWAIARHDEVPCVN